jgi:DNA-binding IscR family transcriptional regulator
LIGEYVAAAEGLVSQNELADLLRLSRRGAGKYIAQAKKEGLIDFERGPGGGYRVPDRAAPLVALAKERGSVTAAEAAKALDVPISKVRAWGKIARADGRLIVSEGDRRGYRPVEPQEPSQAA